MILGSETTSPPGPTNVVWKLSTMSMKKMTSTMLPRAERIRRDVGKTDVPVQHQETDVLCRFVSKGHIERYHYRSVKGETEDDPVPDGFEGAVVQEDVRRRLWRFLLILGQDIGVHCDQLCSWSVRSGLNPSLTHLANGRVLGHDVRFDDRQVCRELGGQNGAAAGHGPRQPRELTQSRFRDILLFDRLLQSRDVSERQQEQDDDVFLVLDGRDLEQEPERSA